MCFFFFFTEMADVADYILKRCCPGLLSSGAGRGPRPPLSVMVWDVEKRKKEKDSKIRVSFTTRNPLSCLSILCRAKN